MSSFDKAFNLASPSTISKAVDEVLNDEQYSELSKEEKAVAKGYLIGRYVNKLKEGAGKNTMLRIGTGNFNEQDAQKIIDKTLTDLAKDMAYSVAGIKKKSTGDNTKHTSSGGVKHDGSSGKF